MHKIKKDFETCCTSEEIYLKIMEWGRKLPPFDPSWKKEENLVAGCQSLLYLHVEVKESTLFFAADSDALISKGLAALLLALYEGKSAEEILTSPPTLLEELRIVGSLTPGRSNGLASLYLRMKQEALKVILKEKKSPQIFLKSQS